MQGEGEDFAKDPAELVAMPQDSSPRHATEMGVAYFSVPWVARFRRWDPLPLRCCPCFPLMKRCSTRGW